MNKSSKNDIDTSGSKHEITMGSSFSHLGRITTGKYSKEQWRDEFEEKFDDNRFNENSTIEKVINGDYEGDDSVNNYSIGSKSFGVQNSWLRDEETIRNISDPLIDPFAYKREDDLYNDKEYETAKLNGENNHQLNQPSKVGIYDANSDFDRSREVNSENSNQMNKFIKWGKKVIQLQDQQDFNEQKYQGLDKVIRKDNNLEK